MGLSGCYSIIKYLLVLINLIFWVVGILGVALAAWMIADPTFYLSMTQEEAKYYIGLYVFLASGALLVLVAFLGCCGAVRESQCMLISFFCIVVIGVVGEAAAVWWGVAHSNQLQDQVRRTVEATVRNDYDGINTRTAAFDAIQQGLKCCGANGPQDWAGSRYSILQKAKSDKMGGGITENVVSSVVSGLTVAVGGPPADNFFLPPSCCVYQGAVCELRSIVTDFNPGVFTVGCADKLMEALQNNMNIMIGTGIGIAVLEILGLAFALVLCLAINRSDRYKA